MGIKPTFRVGDPVHCGNYDGVVAVVVPAVYNPLREIARHGIKYHKIDIHKPVGGFLPLREEESYVVADTKNGKVFLRWPLKVKAVVP